MQMQIGYTCEIFLDIARDPAGRTIDPILSRARSMVQSEIRPTESTKGEDPAESDKARLITGDRGARPRPPRSREHRPLSDDVDHGRPILHSSNTTRSE